MTDSPTRLHIAILFGGRSGEHEISLRSARSVFEALDRRHYVVTLIGIDRGGHWRLLQEDAFLRLTSTSPAEVPSGFPQVTLLPEPTGGRLFAMDGSASTLPPIDVVFPVLHGTLGEDGTVQGLLELAGLPCVGAGVLGSAIGMDKDVQKRLLADAGIPIVPFTVTTSAEWGKDAPTVQARALALGLPLFVKPANLGSSVGITKVVDPEQLGAAVELALEYDRKVVIEHGIDAREIECAVLGNDAPSVSVPGEIRPRGGFYSYEAKYLDEHGAELLIPAPLEASEIEKVQGIAVRAFVALECSGLARVDCFLERNSGKFYLNEINTLPGFTSISMYPKLWEVSGTPYPELLTRLIDLARERQAQKDRLRRDYAVAPPRASSAAARSARE